jgi:L-lactate dehydrogenase complex protein LldG
LIDLIENSDAREAILKSIREHLAASAPHDAIYAEGKAAHEGNVSSDLGAPSATNAYHGNGHDKDDAFSLIEMFRRNLEAVGGRCIVVPDEPEAAQALNGIIARLQTTLLRARRIAISNAAVVGRLMREVELSVDEIAQTPCAAALFGYDVGITSAQGAIAETGTLVLESERERHRLISLIPPVHIAIIEAAKLRRTLGEALLDVRRGGGDELSRAITFITGPSRTADIELTLAIGVHGPQELYVIIINDASQSLR